MQDALSQPGQVFNIPLRLHRKKDGTVFPVEITARSFLQDGEPVLLVSCRDITERQRVASELQAEKTNSEAMFESSPIALFVLDDKTNIVRVNKRAVVLFGGRAVAALQHRPGNALGCVHSSEDPRGCGYSPTCPLCPVRNGIQSLLANGGEINGVDVGLDLIRDGTPQKVWMEIGAKFLQLEGRRHVCIAMVDITARKQAESEQQESNERFRTLFDSSPDPVWIIDNQRFVECNQAAIEMLGYPDKDSLTNFLPNSSRMAKSPIAKPSE
jgi:PAS domain-containing protein